MAREGFVIERNGRYWLVSEATGEPDKVLQAAHEAITMAVVTGSVGARHEVANAGGLQYAARVVELVERKAGT